MITKVLAPHLGRSIMEGFVVFKLFAADTHGALAIVEHLLEPGTLAAPLHTHRNEDEYSYVLQGEVTALIGGELTRASAGALLCKPRNLPHTFWNQGPGSARLLEIIAPGGFESYFDDLAVILASGGPPDSARMTAVAQQYQVEMDFSSLMEICQKYNVWLSGSSPALAAQPQDQFIGEPL